MDNPLCRRPRDCCALGIRIALRVAHGVQLQNGGGERERERRIAVRRERRGNSAACSSYVLALVIAAWETRGGGKLAGLLLACMGFGTSPMQTHPITHRDGRCFNKQPHKTKLGNHSAPKTAEWQGGYGQGSHC